MQGIASTHPTGSGKVLVQDIRHLAKSILDITSVSQVLQFLFGNSYRVDHGFFLHHPGVGVNENLHGGPESCFGSSVLRGPLIGSQTLGASRVTLGITLSEQDENTGGFWFLPGSHRSSFATSGKEVYELLQPHERAQYLDIPTLSAGECHIFFDNLIHGTSDSYKPRLRSTFYLALTAPYLQWKTSNDPTEILDKDTRFQDAYVAKIETKTKEPNGALFVENIMREKK